jgi:hypothetical protein
METIPGTKTHSIESGIMLRLSLQPSKLYPGGLHELQIPIYAKETLLPVCF